jgi:hypothetical protein
MKGLVSVAGSVVGWLGVVVCLVAGLVRLGGSFHLGSYESESLFTVGIGLIAAGCLAKLEALPR